MLHFDHEGCSLSLIGQYVYFTLMKIYNLLGQSHTYTMTCRNMFLFTSVKQFEHVLPLIIGESRSIVGHTDYCPFVPKRNLYK